MIARIVLLSTFLLALVGAAAAQPITRPPAAPPSQSAQPPAPAPQALRAAAEQMLQQHPEAVRQMAQQMAQQRAARMQWLTSRAGDIRWLGLPRLYLADAWLLKEACAEGKCLPNMQVHYGAEGFLALGPFDVYGRFGGVTSFFDRAPTKTGLEAGVGVRYNLLGVVGVGAGWVTQTEAFDLVRDGVIERKTSAHHGLALSATGTLRGITVEAAFDLLWRTATDEAGESWLGFMPMGRLGLVTPPAWGF